jgi:hypothetical protein
MNTLLNIEESSNFGDSLSISLRDGYWRINNKPLAKCSIVKQTLFDQYLKMKLIKLPIIRESSFKYRAKEIKSMYNYTFKIREQNWIGEYPNIELITFERK